MLDMSDLLFHLKIKCPKTLRKLIDEGLVPPHDLLVGTRKRWLRSTIDAFTRSGVDAKGNARSATHQQGKGPASSLAGGDAALRQEPGGASPSHSPEQEDRDAS